MAKEKIINLGGKVSSPSLAGLLLAAGQDDV